MSVYFEISKKLINIQIYCLHEYQKEYDKIFPARNKALSSQRQQLTEGFCQKINDYNPDAYHLSTQVLKTIPNYFFFSITEAGNLHYQGYPNGIDIEGEITKEEMAEALVRLPPLASTPEEARAFLQRELELPLRKEKILKILKQSMMQKINHSRREFTSEDFLILDEKISNFLKKETETTRSEIHKTNYSSPGSSGEQLTIVGQCLDNFLTKLQDCNQLDALNSEDPCGILRKTLLYYLAQKIWAPHLLEKPLPKNKKDTQKAFVNFFKKTVASWVGSEGKDLEKESIVRYGLGLIESSVKSINADLEPAVYAETLKINMLHIIKQLKEKNKELAPTQFQELNKKIESLKQLKSLEACLNEAKEAIEAWNYTSIEVVSPPPIEEVPISPRKEEETSSLIFT